MAKYKKRKDGRYCTHIELGRSADGKRIRKTVMARTIRELEDKIAEVKSLKNKGIVITDSSITLDEWAGKWFEAYKAGCEYNTQEMYRRAIEKHIKAADIAGLPISKITEADLQRLIRSLQDAGLTRTVEIVVMVLKQIFKSAFRNHLIYTNPAADLETPRYRAPQKRPLTDVENKAIAAASDLTDKERAFLYLGKYAGPRKGEILALSVNDFNLKKKTVNINKTVVFKGNTGEIKYYPKSQAGFRTIPLAAPLYDFITGYLSGLDSLSLFLTSDGKVMTKSAYRKMWASILRKLNRAAGGTDTVTPIIDLTAHILRHDYATSLYYAGVDLKTAQYLLGHSDIKMTLEIYTHLDLDNNTAKNKLDAYYGSQMVGSSAKSEVPEK